MLLDWLTEVLLLGALDIETRRDKSLVLMLVGRQEGDFFFLEHGYCGSPLEDPVVVVARDLDKRL